MVSISKSIATKQTIDQLVSLTFATVRRPYPDSERKITMQVKQDHEDVSLASSLYDDVKENIPRQPREPSRVWSELSKHAMNEPLRDIVAWVHRSAADRQQEADQRKKIPRPMNSFMLYLRAYGDVIKYYLKLDNPLNIVSRQQVIKAAAKGWWKEKVSLQKSYKRLALIESQNHGRAYPNYKFRAVRSVKRPSPAQHRRDFQRSQTDSPKGVSRHCSVSTLYAAKKDAVEPKTQIPEMEWLQIDSQEPPTWFNSTFDDYETRCDCAYEDVVKSYAWYDDFGIPVEAQPLYKECIDPRLLRKTPLMYS